LAVPHYTIKGKGFLPGKNRNTVVFKAAGGRAVFAKAESATTTKLVVTLAAKLAAFLGCLSDDERDEDGDLLANFDEVGGRMSSAAWWTTQYSTEGTYPRCG
jgi:hypothetical protein